MAEAKNLAAVLARLRGPDHSAQTSSNRLEKTTPTYGQIRAVDPVNAVVIAAVPARYAGASPEHVPELEKVDVSAAGALFTGLPGRGKTYAAVALARMWLSRRQKALRTADGTIVSVQVPSLRFVTAPMLISECRSTMCRGSQTSMLDVIEKYTGCDLLILDDLGMENQTDYASDAVYTILSERQNAMRYTVVTTNMGKDAMLEWRANILSRFAEWSRVNFGGADRRLQQTDERRLRA